jgi:hypothetical protein
MPSDVYKCMNTHRNKYICIFKCIIYAYMLTYTSIYRNRCLATHTRIQAKLPISMHACAYLHTHTHTCLSTQKEILVYCLEKCCSAYIHTYLSEAADLQEANMLYIHAYIHIQVKLLISERARISLFDQDEDGCTALHHAAMRGYVGVINMLAAAGGINLLVIKDNNAGERTAREYAQFFRKKDAEKLLKDWEDRLQRQEMRTLKLNPLPPRRRVNQNRHT